MDRKDEALLLCCCYIEALGSRQSSKPGLKAKNYCGILIQHGGNKLWSFVHPSQIKSVLSSNRLFSSAFATLASVIDSAGLNLLATEELDALLSASLNEKQRAWLQDNMYKGSMAYISYERIRSELVHDISADHSLAFNQTQYMGSPVPTINFELLYKSLHNIVNTLECKALLR
jgi:hypothetical protein